MSTPSISRSDILEQVIRRVRAAPVQTHRHTGHVIFDYLVELGSGDVVVLTPSTIGLWIPSDVALVAPRMQVMSGAPSIEGTEVAGVVIRDSADGPKALRDREQSDFRQVALNLSDGRTIANVYLAGGGSVLHVESGEGVERHVGDGWRDFWTGEPTRLTVPKKNV